jgi:4-amino-4-deoxy-L-arabinose transferase-like glycosyltransferase
MACRTRTVERLSAPRAVASNGRAATVLGCGLLIAASVIVNQSAVHWRENVVDSHLFAWHGWCVSQGARPYLDIWDNKPPGIWWANAAGFWLFGEGVGGELLVCSVALATALVAFTAIARCAYHRSITLIAALTGCVLVPHLVYEGGANRTETFVLACESVAVLGYLGWLRRGRWTWLAAAGIAAGAAPLFKQSGLAAAAAIGLHMAWGVVQAQFRSRGRELVSASGVKPVAAAAAPIPIFAAGCVLAPTVAGAVLAAQGALAECWYAIGAFNRAYFDIHDATYLRVDRALYVFKEALVPLIWMFAAALVGVIWGLVRERVRRRRVAALGGEGAPAQSQGQPEPRTYVGLFWLWLALAVYLACVGPGRRGHHFMPALAPLGLLALYPLHLLASNAGIWRRIAAQPSIAGLLVVYLYAVALLARGTAIEIDHCWQQKTHWYSLAYAAPPGWQQQAVEIRRLTRPDEAIYVWGWSPGTYRYAYRRAASRYATFEKVGQLGGRGQFILDCAKQDLLRDPPRVFVISPADVIGLAQDQDEFRLWLTNHYVDRGVIGGMHILAAR